VHLRESVDQSHLILHSLSEKCYSPLS